MSSGWPMRPAGVCATTWSSKSGLPQSAWANFVRTKPGAMALTWMFSPPNSAASVLVRLMTPALVAL